MHDDDPRPPVRWERFATEPVQRCSVCDDYEIVRPDGRGFPPDIAKRRLAKRCEAAGHACQARYTAGISGARPVHDGPCVFVDHQCSCGSLEIGLIEP